MFPKLSKLLQDNPVQLASDDPDCPCENHLYWATEAGCDCQSVNIIYFYHHDYLGSVEYITDMRGEPYQFFLNTPWGENLENQFAKNYTSFSSRFRFNGKEWDEETGNYYYGARYYDPKVSVWLGVDALAQKYPSLSPYTFVANNPIMLVDPDGRQIDPASQSTWDKNKESIEAEAVANSMLFSLTGINEFSGRSDILSNTLDGMAKLEDPSNPQVYKIASAFGGVAVTHMDSEESVVIETDGTTGSFAHEVQHAIQFENNKLAFIPDSRKLSISSLQNEVEGYQAELAYNGSLHEGINPSIPNVNSLQQINKSFILGIIDPRNGTSLYSGQGIMSIGPDMNYQRVNAAFPNLVTPAKPGETLRKMFPQAKWRK